MTKRRLKKRNASEDHKTTQHAGPHPVFQPINDEQNTAYEMCEDSIITFLTGAAGSSKTYTAIAYATDQLLAENVSKIILARPAVEACGESMGYLPGTADQKVSAYMIPLYDNLTDYAKGCMDAIRPSLSVAPLAYLRGRTLKDAIVILDEAQNATQWQLEMFLTRLGMGSRMILCGDTSQADISNTPLMRIATRLSKINAINHFHFSTASAAIRHPLLPDIIAAFEELGNANPKAA